MARTPSQTPVNPPEPTQLPAGDGININPDLDPNINVNPDVDVEAPATPEQLPGAVAPMPPVFDAPPAVGNGQEDGAEVDNTPPPAEPVPEPPAPSQPEETPPEAPEHN